MGKTARQVKGKRGKAGRQVKKLMSGRVEGRHMNYVDTTGELVDG